MYSAAPFGRSYRGPTSSAFVCLTPGCPACSSCARSPRLRKSASQCNGPLSCGSSPEPHAGGGWLIFAAPPSELACHPAESNGKHELYLMCDDLRAEIARLGEKGIACGPVSDQEWGLL